MSSQQIKKLDLKLVMALSIKPKRALISVYDKSGIVEFAKELERVGVELVSSGGTAKLLANSGISVKEVSDFTGFPEMMDGRVKTLHPKVHGAILADRSKKTHLDEAKKNKIELIDLVVVNLYPFEEVVLKNASGNEIIENIDIGGPALVRSAAKNYDGVAVIVNPVRYAQVLEEMGKGSIGSETLERLALEAFEHVAHYDTIIANYFRKQFGKEVFPDYMNISFRKLQDLRYGENPHQKAALYRDSHFKGPSVLAAKQLQGKQLSYNNILDATAAFELCKEFEGPTAVVVKHNNPSGVASSKSTLEAYKNARSVDPEAAFGGVVAINQVIDEQVATEITKYFVEVVIAPGFSDGAKIVFSARKNLRILEMPDFSVERKPYFEYRSVPGGLLVQDANIQLLGKELKVVTKRKPTDAEMKEMMYAWKIAKHVKSNSIVFARENRAIGIGAGQMKRVDAAKLAAMVAKDYSGEESLKGCAMASDAFFPFRDGIDFAAKLGVSAIIQPGGSIKDEEVIAAANEHDIAMVFTGMRHFRH